MDYFTVYTESGKKLSDALDFFVKKSKMDTREDTPIGLDFEMMTRSQFRGKKYKKCFEHSQKKVNFTVITMQVSSGDNTIVTLIKVHLLPQQVPLLPRCH